MKPTRVIVRSAYSYAGTASLSHQAPPFRLGIWTSMSNYSTPAPLRPRTFFSPMRALLNLIDNGPGPLLVSSWAAVQTASYGASSFSSRRLPRIIMWVFEGSTDAVAVGTISRDPLATTIFLRQLYYQAINVLGGCIFNIEVLILTYLKPC